MSAMDRILTTISIFVTILNVIVAVPSSISLSDPVVLSIPTIQAMSFSTRIVLLAILEASLAFAFGFMAYKIAEFDNMLSHLGFIILSFLSAGLSLFNIRIILAASNVFAPLFAICIMSCLFMFNHVEEEGFEMALSATIIQLIAFIIIYISSFY